MPSVHFVRPPELAPAPYAHATVADPGRLVVSAGACPLDADGAVVADGDVAGQARQVMANLRTALEAAGAGLGAVVKTTVHVATTERGDLDDVWDVVAAAFGDHEPPSTLVGVTVLGYPGQLVEVEALAVLQEWQEPGPPADEITDDPPPGASSTVTA